MSAAVELQEKKPSLPETDVFVSPPPAYPVQASVPMGPPPAYASPPQPSYPAAQAPTLPVDQPQVHVKPSYPPSFQNAQVGPHTQFSPPQMMAPAAPQQIMIQTNTVNGGGGAGGAGMGGGPVGFRGRLGGATPSCRRCRLGFLNHDYCTCWGVICSIAMFPCGLLCLLCCRDTWCTNCGKH